MESRDTSASKYIFYDVVWMFLFIGSFLNVWFQKYNFQFYIIGMKNILT